MIQKPSGINISQTFRINERLLLKEEGSGMIAFDPDSLAVHQLNRSMAHVARLCQQSASGDALVVDFSETYGLDRDEATSTILQALRVLKQHEMIVTV